MRPDRSGKLSLHPLSGHWYRALSLTHWKTRLSTEHTRTAASRFGAASEAAPGPAFLYLGENHQVAIYEVGALLGDPGSPVSDLRGSWVVMSLEVRLEGVADLCDPAEQSIIETSHQELTGDWMNGRASHRPRSSEPLSTGSRSSRDSCSPPPNRAEGGTL